MALVELRTLGLMTIKLLWKYSSSITKIGGKIPFSHFEAMQGDLTILISYDLPLAVRYGYKNIGYFSRQFSKGHLFHTFMPTILVVSTIRFILD
jgi:hypothetical protein